MACGFWMVSDGCNQSSSTLDYVIFESLYRYINAILNAGKSFSSSLNILSMSFLRRRMRTQVDEELLYWLFLNLHCDSIFRALRPCFFDGRFSTMVCQDRLAPAPSENSLVTFRTSWLPESLLADRLTMTINGYSRINNFITPTLPSSLWFAWFAFCFQST